jgi:lysophospholipase L1-like esterase
MLPGSPVSVVCIGDSITSANVSVDYIQMLRERFSADGFAFTNAGQDGDLAWNVLQRLDAIIELRPDVVTVLVGTNDASASLSDKNVRIMTRMKKLIERPTIDTYRRDLTAIGERLASETSARIALLSLPVLGEEFGSDPVLRSVDYSAVVKDVADQHGLAYLPLNEQQLAHLREHQRPPRIAFRNGVGLAARTAIEHIFLRQSLDKISQRRGLELTIDFVHQNTLGATMIAGLIEGFLATLLTEQ